MKWTGPEKVGKQVSDQKKAVVLVGACAEVRAHGALEATTRPGRTGAIDCDA